MEPLKWSEIRVPTLFQRAEGNTGECKMRASVGLCAVEDP